MGKGGRGGDGENWSGKEEGGQENLLWNLKLKILGRILKKCIKNSHMYVCILYNCRAGQATIVQLCDNSNATT